MAGDGTSEQPGGPEDADLSDGRRDTSPSIPEGDILGALPRTRPQRASPRRAAAHAKSDQDRTSRKSGVARSGAAKATTGSVKATTGAAKAGKAASGKSKPSTSRKPPARRASTRKAAGANDASRKAPPHRNQPRAPKQGYEPEEEQELGATVHPPSGVELVESVADIFLELANVGLKAGGRALKDVLSPLRRS